ncbi:complement regulator-acquiring protein (plasmid) [Borrelia sp. CA_690]|uniref:Complement regulator-acquiring protein n=1 Tax=Borrelia maritima TaxID=2761123 RepID=A0A5J6WB77_9SPIR|nr:MULTISPECIES: complement regulator-acquiring protein [Borrelia]QFI15004.1 complement regulator-acquiring protein [Borrelia maritima]WKC84011.1 complement regulator-acquiring protein [Borrelia sp. CA_690]
MTKNKIYKILKLLQMTLLFSCSFYSKSNNTEATSELQSSPIEIGKVKVLQKTEKIQNTENIVDIQNITKIENLQKDQFLKIEKEKGIKNFIQELNENEKLINKIGTYVEIFAQKINADVQKIEPIDKFGINANKFPIENEFHLKLFAPNNLFRRLFYSSLNYDENKIKKLVTVLSQISSSGTTHYELIGLTFWTGWKIQDSLEQAVNLLTKKEQKRIMLNFRTKTAKEIQENLEKLIQERNTWITIVDDIIGEYNNNTGGSRADGRILGEIIRVGYKHKLEPSKSAQILNNIQKALKECCDHIHY